MSIQQQDQHWNAGAIEIQQLVLPKTEHRAQTSLIETAFIKSMVRPAACN